MSMKLKERQGVTAGVVLTVFLTGLFTATAQADVRTETFMKTLGFSAVCVGFVGFFVHKYNKAQDQSESP